ncbi:type VI secretion system protein TssA [Paucibacter sp. R3-3]|uniref:Type VI secretion system protein TssA n=1 Tax=Roseateles agri TaxID=3098619 RepID=A0ABU5DAH0_9BURK|nr:type VI secretion system protein TssA [Paucibacter sp. R3-3]MDY0743276.1 type VI secretion system protein TssA [Paucibacter sp. R3-3]
MTELELQTLTAPLPGDAPCGADLQFDADFLALEEAAAGQPEREYGKTLIPAKGPDWRSVRQLAMQLALRTRDLRLAVWLTRSGAHLGGLADAARGLQLVHALLQQHWDTVHPQIEPVQAQGETSRLNAIAPLLRDDAGLADLRAARLSSQRAAITVREIELAANPGLARKGEPAPTKEGALAGMAAARQEVTELNTLMLAAHTAAIGIDEVLTTRLGATRTMELTPLTRLTAALAQIAALAAGAEAASTPEATAAATAPAPAMSGEINSREEAIRALERICDWIERNEPASPAPIFIRRSQQLLQKSFIEIIRDLLPDNVKQIEHFVGKTS